MKAVEDVIKNLSHRPGVYRMVGTDGEVLYVGKARDLKKRVASYFQRRPSSTKTEALVRQVTDVRVTITATEAEALLLECNLIKRHRPRFNVLYRDDKSYPYIHVSTDHEFPRLSFYRGSRRVPGKLFGPYASAGAVRETLNYLHKLFRLRQCTDSFLENRTRPCLQYQIKRCSAPCVDLIDREAYQRDVEDAMLFLTGRSEQVVQSLVKRMEQSSAELDYESAARYRDQIATIKRVEEHQLVAGTARDLDVIAHAEEGGLHAVGAMFIRSGRNLGSRTYFPRAAAGADDEEIVAAFLSQYYLRREPPAEIIIDTPVDDAELFEQAFSDRAGRKVRIKSRVRGARARWLEMALTNARHDLNLRRLSRATLGEQLKAVGEALQLDKTPERIECFDVSHTGGEAAVAACVVFGPEGAVKNDYRRFNISGIEPGDDYGAMQQALTRRYRRIKKGDTPLPDILLIDGGKGQVGEAARVLTELDIGAIKVVGVAKGPSRRPGLEQLYVMGERRARALPPESMALHLIQQVRDEAHRFAIGGHRARRAKSRRTSVLESIPGLGPKRRRDLLKQFGGLQGVSRAGVDDLVKVKGISRALASAIYDTFH